MVLVCDNAPYHHKRDIGSLSSKTKSELAQLYVKHSVEYLDLPLTDQRYCALGNADEDIGIQVLGDDC
jgi:hypothetical protein